MDDPTDALSVETTTATFNWEWISEEKQIPWGILSASVAWSLRDSQILLQSFRKLWGLEEGVSGRKGRGVDPLPLDTYEL